ncbi:hypothetical protein OG395_48405 [Streptomyces sp. NBC_01320]|nr:hypothetical protein OG395_48405 [Streptomyces sp. NBC_01320]
MTAPGSLPFTALLEETLASASPDLLRQMVKPFADAMMSADVDNAYGIRDAPEGLPSPTAVNASAAARCGGVLTGGRGRFRTADICFVSSIGQPC